MYCKPCDIITPISLKYNNSIMIQVTAIPFREVFFAILKIQK